MSKLPAGVHFVCIVSIDVRKPRSGGSDYIAVSLYSFTGSHVGHTFIDRLSLWSTNPKAASKANERYAQYCMAAGVDVASISEPSPLYFKPFAVKITGDRKSDQLKVSRVDPVPTGFQVEFHAFCERLRRMGPMFAPEAEGDQAGSEGPQDDADELIIQTVANVSTPKQGLGRSQMDKAKAFLQFQLSNGDVEQHVLMQRAEFHSLTERTLQRAAEPLGIIKRKEGFGPGARSVWGYARPGDALFRHDA